MMARAWFQVSRGTSWESQSGGSLVRMVKKSTGDSGGYYAGGMCPGIFPWGIPRGGIHKRALDPLAAASFSEIDLTVARCVTFRRNEDPDSFSSSGLPVCYGLMLFLIFGYFPF